MSGRDRLGQAYTGEISEVRRSGGVPTSSLIPTLTGEKINVNDAATLPCSLTRSPHNPSLLSRTCVDRQSPPPFGNRRIKFSMCFPRRHLLLALSGFVLPIQTPLRQLRTMGNATDIGKHFMRISLHISNIFG